MTYVATAEATDEHNAVYLATFMLLNEYDSENDYTYLSINNVVVDSVTLIEEPK